MTPQASLLTSSMAAAPVSSYGQRLAARIDPGQTFETVAGHVGRILRKSASAEGIQLQAAINGKVRVLSAEQFAELYPVSPAMHRLASFVHHIIAFNAEIDTYVKEAIREAGLPVDPSMNWAKYLYRMYGPMLSRFTKDPDVISDAIIEVIVQELYVKKLLRPDSPFSHFNPDHEKLSGKELDKKVSAFLTAIFKGRMEMVRENARRIIGVGAKGELGLATTESLNTGGDEEGGLDSDEYNPYLSKGVENGDIQDLESENEVHGFLKAFVEDSIKQQRKGSQPILEAITREYLKGAQSDDIKERVMSDPQLEKDLGEKINRDAYNYAIRLWARLIKVYAEDPHNRWSKTPIAKAIAAMAKRLDKTLDTKTPSSKPRVMAASLRLADYVQNGQPPEEQQEQQQQQPAPAMPPPPPPSPNVQQQNAVRNQNGLSMAPPATDADPNDDMTATQPNQQKKTIPQEIPGVNHTASTEKSMSSSVKKATPALAVPRAVQNKAAAADKPTVVPVKYATLRTIAKREPRELGAALGQLHASFQSITSKLAAVIDNLDLAVPAPKAGSSVREKVAYRSRYAANLRRVAEENPEQVDEVVNDLYSGLDEIVTEIENLADNLDIELVEPVSEAEPSVAEEDFEQEPLAEDLAEEPLTSV